MASETTRVPLPRRTEITSEYDVGTLWKSTAFPRGDRTSLHLHFLDHDIMEAPGDPPSSPLTEDPVASVDPSKISQQLKQDLSSLSAFTDGILLSWGGESGGGSRSSTIVTDAVSHLFQDGDLAHSDFRTGRSICVTVPSTGQVREDIPAHHVLMPSHDHSSTQVLKYLMNTSVNDGKPVVCLVVGGGTRVLKMVCYALEHDIPVIIVKGTGGIADVIGFLGAAFDVNYKQALWKKIVTHPVIRALRKEDNDRLYRLWDSYKRLTFYSPTEARSKHLDATILDALLKSEQFQQAEKYLETLQRRVKDRKEVVPKQLSCFLGDSEDGSSRVDIFLHSLVSHTPSACAVIVRSLQISFSSITFDQLMHLYQKSPERRRTSTKKKIQIFRSSFLNSFCHADIDEDGIMIQRSVSLMRYTGKERYKQVREDLKRYTQHLMATPLSCPGHDKCKNCQAALKATAGERPPQTCLPPVQELFLWSLFFGDPDLSEALMEHVEGKIAACLFAFAIFTGMARRETEREQEQTLTQYARRFEDLATHCLRSCYEADVLKAEKLLVQKFDNWDSFSPLQIAIVTESKAFVAEDGVKNRLDLIWNGSKKWLSGSEESSSCRDDVLRIFTPAFAYILDLVFQLLFLLLFSYVMLFELQNSPTFWFFLLGLYVIDLLADEIQQLLTGSPVLRTGSTCNLKEKLRAYFSQTWNYVDVLAIVLFAVGMLEFVDDELAYAFGRVFLCLDALVFFLRFLQMLLYFKNLGIFLVMAKRSMKDTMYFMLILLTVMWGYLVSSHGVLFPPPNNTTSTWSYVLDLPFKGYWQAFNLDLEAISVCQEVTHPELEYGECKTESVVATSYGHYVASVLLALYLMFINVLLMNLLIAKFNHTFTEVHQEAELHQSWQYCQLVLEYYTHTPAPFSVFSAIFTTLLSLCRNCCRGVLQGCCPCRNGFASFITLIRSWRGAQPSSIRGISEENEPPAQQENLNDADSLTQPKPSKGHRTPTNVTEAETSLCDEGTPKEGEPSEDCGTPSRVGNEADRQKQQPARQNAKNEDSHTNSDKDGRVLFLNNENVSNNGDNGDDCVNFSINLNWLLDAFETEHMQKVLRRTETATGDTERGELEVTMAGVQRQLSSMQRQLDQLRYGLQQVLRKPDSQPSSPFSQSHPFYSGRQELRAETFA